MIKYRFQNRIVCAAIAALFLFVGAACAERPSLYGFSLAYPKKLSEVTNEEGFPPILQEKNLQVQLSIDKKGKVKSVRAVNPTDSGFAKAIGKHFVTVPFEPALNNGKVVDCNLLMNVRILPKSFRAVFSLPVSTAQIVTNNSLYLKSMELNGITLPRLVSFPSYWCNLSIADSTDEQKFIVLELACGKTGNIENVRVVASSYPAFESQIVSAATRAIITPPTVKGKPLAASAFLCFTFYRGNNYPTPPFNPETVSSLPLRERKQLLCVADTVGLLSGPVPKFNPAESITGGGDIADIVDTVAVYLSVSASGKGGCLRHDDVPPPLSKWIRSTAAWMKFYPAVDFSGKQSSFAGTAYFIFSDSTSVRIVYPWFE